MCIFSDLFCNRRRARRTCGYQHMRVVDAGGRRSCACECPCRECRGF